MWGRSRCAPAPGFSDAQRRVRSAFARHVLAPQTTARAIKLTQNVAHDFQLFPPSGYQSPVNRVFPYPKAALNRDIVNAPEAEHRRSTNGGSCPNHLDDADASAFLAELYEPIFNLWRQPQLPPDSGDGDLVNRQGDDIATSAHFVRYRTNSTLSSLSPTIYAGASDWVGANDHQANRRET